MKPKLVKERLEKALNCPISEEQAVLLNAHLAFVIEQNRNLNLTRIQDEEAGIVLHIEDSLHALSELNKAPNGPFVDLGSGAGFPGIPLAILSARNCTLVEATKKKAQFLQRFIQARVLEDQITIAAQRIEAFSQQKQGYFSVATVRALSSLPTLMELAAPLLQKDGVLLAYKGDLTQEEIERSHLVEETLGMTVRSIRSFVLSDNQSKRSIVLIQKKADAKRLLPRREGQAQHHPLA
jgi:16S rRNA (guanine527-N7)-methyltransferase